MSIYQEVAVRTVDLASLNPKGGPTVGIWTGATGGTIVCVLAQDPDSKQTTLAGVPAGAYLPISIKTWVSGPADAVGFAV